MCCIVIFEWWVLWCWMLSVEWLTDERYWALFLAGTTVRDSHQHKSCHQNVLKADELSCFYEVFKTSTFSSFRRYSFSQKTLYYKRWWDATSFQGKTIISKTVSSLWQWKNGINWVWTFVIPKVSLVSKEPFSTLCVLPNIVCFFCSNS